MIYRIEDMPESSKTIKIFKNKYRMKYLEKNQDCVEINYFKFTKIYFLI